MRNSDFAILAAILCVAMGITAAMLLHPSQADGAKADTFASEPSEAAYIEPKEEPTAPAQAEEPEQPDAPEQAGEPEQTDYVQVAQTYEPGTYYAEYDPAYNENGPTREMPGWYDGYLETYYNASAHYLAPTWTLDDEGFYRDSEGRYVVGVEISHADEMPYGTVVMTGRGEAAVYDYGAGAEVHDFATAW